MIDIRQIVDETVDLFLDNVITEAKKKSGGKGNGKSKRKNDTEKTNKNRKETRFQKAKENAKRRDGNNVSKGDENNLRRDFTNGGYINISAVARKLYPDHTDAGAQSQLRKKLKGLKNDFGSEYHLTQRESAKLKKIQKEI